MEIAVIRKFWVFRSDLGCGNFRLFSWVRSFDMGFRGFDCDFAVWGWVLLPLFRVVGLAP